MIKNDEHLKIAQCFNPIRESRNRRQCRAALRRYPAFKRIVERVRRQGVGGHCSKCRYFWHSSAVNERVTRFPRQRHQVFDIQSIDAHLSYPGWQ